MHDLIIIGAGGFGREVALWASEVQSQDWSLRGFLDDRSEALEGYAGGVSILGKIEDYAPRENDLFVCAIGDPKLKGQIYRDFKSRGARFVSLVHPTAIIGQRSRVGVGCIICPRVTITCDVVIEDFVTINMHSTVGHDAVVGEGSTLSCHVDITGGVRVGKGVLVGSHASILPLVNIGDDAVVGAASLVVREVSPGTTVMGVPAKRLI
jgi:sugar O-acyltransferase (sialic acid O-acetyltransferase NeuD family)